MKYITLIIGLLVVGCGTPTENTTKAKPVKELTLEERVIGTYEGYADGHPVVVVFLENGVLESYENGKKNEVKSKWIISKEGEMHIIDEGEIGVFRIDTKSNLGTSPVSSITFIAVIDKDG